ncbi:MAG TPA: hypothetical protein VJP86_10075 [Vicinamibacterales bacterium]|jgi:hypothetical protein|nr:hypothetical protein [Vicinamibacterales bacterium]
MSLSSLFSSSRRGAAARRFHTPAVPAIVMVSIAASGVALGAVKFTSTWAAPEARAASFKGKKVAALVVSEDMSLRMSAESALSRELTSRGMTGAVTYSLIPKEELRDVERAKGWFERAAIAGVVVLRPISIDKIPKYSPDIWLSTSYSSFWSYYPYGWTTVYSPPPQVVGHDTVVVVESLIYDVNTGKLLWAGVSEAKNPKNLQGLVADIVDEAAKKIEKQFK